MATLQPATQPPGSGDPTQAAMLLWVRTCVLVALLFRSASCLCEDLVSALEANRDAFLPCVCICRCKWYLHVRQAAREDRRGGKDARMTPFGA